MVGILMDLGLRGMEGVEDWIWEWDIEPKNRDIWRVEDIEAFCIKTIL